MKLSRWPLIARLLGNRTSAPEMPDSDILASETSPIESHKIKLAGKWSLRRRLLLTVMASSVGMWLVSLGIIVGVAWHATSEVFDDALEEGARLILQLAPRGYMPSGAQLALPQGREAALGLRMYYQLVSAEGKVLLRGEDTPDAAFVPDADDEMETTVWADGELWRVYIRPGPGGVTAQVAQPMEERLEMLEDMAENLAWPSLILLVALGLLAWFLLQRLLRPLEQAASRISAKSPHDLTPVQADNPPRELQSILSALNALLARLSSALESERRFTADAAHELRTPLAALRMRVQLMTRELQLPDKHSAQLRADLDRCTALVESLLLLARLEPQSEPLVREQVNLDQLLDKLMNDVQGDNTRLNRDLQARQIHASPVLLASALRNLIDNAVRYGGENVQIRVESTLLPGNIVRLAVRDNGPGVPPDMHTRLGERFFRVLGTGQPGNGLGLSIVARIMALHGGVMRFEQGLGGRGLGVVLEFPA